MCAGGLRGLKYGVTRNYVLGLEAPALVGPDGLGAGVRVLLPDAAVGALVGLAGTDEPLADVAAVAPAGLDAGPMHLANHRR